MKVRGRYGRTCRLFLAAALLIGMVLSAGGLVHAQGQCVESAGNPVVTCTGDVDTLHAFFIGLTPEEEALVTPLLEVLPPSWRLVVIGREAEAVDEGALQAEGGLPVAAVIIGEDNRLLNQDGAKITAVYSPNELSPDDPILNSEASFGVWLFNTRGSDGRDGESVWNLENHGLIEAKGGAALSIEEGEEEDRRPVLPPNEVWYTSGVLLIGHHAAVQNTGTIRAEQVVAGEGQDYRFIGLSSYWSLLGDNPDYTPAPSVIVNEGENALIEGDGHRAIGVLLKKDPTAGPIDGEDFHQQLLNKGGTIRALGRQEAFGVNIVNGYTRLDNDGLIEAKADKPDGAAVGVRAAGEVLRIENNDQGIITAVGKDAKGVLLITKTATFDNKGTILVKGTDSAIGVEGSGAGLQLSNTGTVAVDSGRVARGFIAAGAGVNVTNSGEVVARIVPVVPVGVTVAEAGDTPATSAVGTLLVGDGSALANAGDISALGATESVGVWLKEDNQTFQNHSGSTVRAEGTTAIGVWVTGTDDKVVNEGTIEAVRQTDDVVAADTEGTGNRVAAIALDGENADVDNKGTVRGLGTGAVGIDMQRAGGESKNAGRIEVQGVGAVGVQIDGPGSRFVNEKGGLVEAKGEGSVGVSLRWSGVTDALPFDNSGKLRADGAGVFVGVEGDHDGEMVNSGDVSGGTAGVHFAFAAGTGDATVTLKNTASGEITGTGGVAVLATDESGDGTGTGSVFLENAGKIYGRVDLRNGGDHEVTSSGILSWIAGDVLLGTGNDVVTVSDGSIVAGNLDLGGGDDAVTVRSSGVTGQIRLGSGEDTITVDTGVRIGGMIDGGRSADDQLEDDRLVLQSGTGTGQLRGVENFRFIDNSAGGLWEIGQLTVRGNEQLDVNGSLTAGLVWLGPDSVLVIDDLVINNLSIYEEFNQAGFLAGSGTIRGDVRIQGGHISPGDDEGDMSRLIIEGDYVQGSDATYVVDLQPVQPGEQFGQSDQIVVTGGGTALFEKGSRIEVRAAPGFYGRESLYLIVDGQLHQEMIDDPERLASLEVVTNSPLLIGSLRAGSLILVLKTDFSIVGRTPNQKAVAKALSEAPEGLFRTIEEALIGLGPDTEAIYDALDQMSGEIYTAYRGVGEITVSQFNRMITRGIDLPVPVEEKKIWADVYAHSSRNDRTSGTAHWDLRQIGAVFGIGKDVSERTRLGLLGGVNRTEVDMPSRRSKSTGDGFQVGAYARYRGQSSSLTGIVAYSQGRHDVERNIRFGSYQTTAKGRVDERAWAITIEGRLHREISGFQVEPLLSLTWMDVKQDSVRESGGDVARLNISEAGMSFLRGIAGVRVGTKPADVGVWPEFFLAWVQDFQDMPHTIDVAFAADPERPFTIEGTQVGRSGLVAGVSIEGVRQSGVTWQLGYRGEFRDKRSAHTGMLSFHFPF